MITQRIGYAADLAILIKYKADPHILCESQRRWIRARAFTHECRDADYLVMLDALIPIYTIKAVKERLTT